MLNHQQIAFEYCMYMSIYMYVNICILCIYDNRARCTCTCVFRVYWYTIKEYSPGVNMLQNLPSLSVYTDVCNSSPETTFTCLTELWKIIQVQTHRKHENKNVSYKVYMYTCLCTRMWSLENIYNQTAGTPPWPHKVYSPYLSVLFLNCHMYYVLCTMYVYFKPIGCCCRLSSNQQSCFV